MSSDDGNTSSYIRIATAGDTKSEIESSAKSKEVPKVKSKPKDFSTSRMRRGGPAY